MCCQAKWKRQAIPEHKFDFIDTAEFHTNDWFTRFRYLFVYIFLLKNLAVYALDIYTAATMIASSTWTNVIYRKCGNDCAIKIPFDIAKWVFVGCIAFGFLLLGYETWKARRVIKSRDIGLAYTSIYVNDYYSLKSYDTFCFFCQISNSTKKQDEFAFFVFFQFKDWKRLLLSDAPRQAINACTLYSFAYANNFQTHDLPAYWDNSVSTLLLLLAMVATVALFACSLLLMITAAVCYVPLVCYIQGNLKEYCCYKVDKRIGELLRHRQRIRIRRQLALEKQADQGGVLKDRNGKVVGTLAQPTLPTLDFMEDDDDMRMQNQRTGRRKSIARFARSLSRKPKRLVPAAATVADEAGVGLPPLSRSMYPSNEVYPLRQGAFGTSAELGDPYGSQVNLAGQAEPFAGTGAYAPASNTYTQYRAAPISYTFLPERSATDHQMQYNQGYQASDTVINPGRGFDDPSSLPYDYPAAQGYSPPGLYDCDVIYREPSLSQQRYAGQARF